MSMSDGEALYELQQVDRALLKHHKRLKAITSALDDNEAVQTAQQRVEAAEDKLKPLQKQAKDLELQSQTTTQKRKSSEQRLYSGSVKNPKELQDLQNEIDALGRRNDELDNQMLEVMVATEDAEGELTARQEELKQVTQQWQAEHSDLLDEQASINQEISKLDEQREDLIGRIADELLKRYEALRPRKGNQPVALLQEGSCSACGIQQNAERVKQIRQSDELLNCQNCQRILVYTS